MVVKNEDHYDGKPGVSQKGYAVQSKDNELRQAQQSLALLKAKMQNQGRGRPAPRANPAQTHLPPVNSTTTNYQNVNAYNLKGNKGYSVTNIPKTNHQQDMTGGYVTPNSQNDIRPPQSYSDKQGGYQVKNSRTGGLASEVDNHFPGSQQGIGDNQARSKNTFGYGSPAQERGRQPRNSYTGHTNYPVRNMTHTELGNRREDDFGPAYEQDNYRGNLPKSAQAPVGRGNRNTENQFQDRTGYQRQRQDQPAHAQSQAGDQYTNIRQNKTVSSHYPEESNYGRQYNRHDDMQRNPRENRQMTQKPRYEAPQEEEQVNNDDAPIRPLQHGFDERGMEEDEEYRKIQLYKCRAGCGRRFAAETLDTHERNCKKVFQQKRKAVDMSKKRLEPEMLQELKQVQRENVGKKDTKSKKKNEIPKWKMESAQLKMATKLARGEKVENTEEARLAKMVEKSGTVDCPHCGRNFNEKAGERHIPFCEKKSKANRLKQPPSNNTTLKQPLNQRKR